MDLQVIDNFLGDYQFKQLESFLFRKEFPWYYNDNIISGDNRYQFTHMLYDSELGVTSGGYEMMYGCLNKLNVKKLIRIKANLRPQTLFHRSGGYHIDTENVTTAILYLNTCNGGTIVIDPPKERFIESEANKIIIFPCEYLHRGVMQTDTIRRAVININYE